MKTSKTISQVAAEWRAKNGNETSISKINTGKVFQFKAKDLRQEIIRQSVINFKRKKSQLKADVRIFCKKLIEQKLYNIANSLPNSGYSMGARYTVSVGRYYGTKDTCDNYSKSCQYKATHGSHSITLTPKFFNEIKFISGVPTVLSDTVGHKVQKATWITSKGKKNNYEIILQNGFVTDDYHASYILDAQNWRTRKAKVLLNTRKNNKEQALYAAKVERAKMLFYGLEHALAAGNCVPGIDSFVSTEKLNKDFGYRGDLLLELATRNGRKQNIMNMLHVRANSL